MPLIIAALLMSFVALAPLSGFAESNGDKKDKNDNNKSDKKELTLKIFGAKSEKDDADDKKDNAKKEDKNAKSCLRAFGHLIAPGWIAHNGPIDWNLECQLPFGIGKKFTGNNASSTPDILAPVISGIAFRPAKTQAEVRWVTNERSDSTVFLSTVSPVNQSATTTVITEKKNLTKTHEIILKRLSPGTTYYVLLRSKDAAGNVAMSNTLSFSTQATSSDTKLPVISNIVTVSVTSTLKVGWMTNENTTGRVYYSATLPVLPNAANTVFIGSTASTKNHLVTIPNLTANTTYFLVIESTDTAGNVSTSATFAARTLVLPVTPDTTPPVISALSTSVGTSSMTVQWFSNEPASGRLFYSTSTPINTSSTNTSSFIENTSLSTNHSLTLSGLATSTVYYMAVQSADGSGNKAISTEFSVTTGT